MSEETPLSSDDQPAEVTGEAATPAWESNGTNGGGETAATLSPSEPAERDDAPDDGSAFLANLASAMKEAATAERTRVTEDVDRRREAHLAGIESRRDTEAGRIRQLAEDDRAAIRSWVESEQQRINEERDRRTTALEADLQASLAEHGAKIDAEKAQVEAAITSHRADIDAYFGKLEGETDPVAIAQQASQRPAFPDLDAIGREPASPTAGGPAGSPDRMIGVMASSRPTTKLSQAWAAWNASTAAAEAAAAEGQSTVTEATPAVEASAGAEPAPAPNAGAAPAIVDPQVNPVDPGPVPEPVGVAAGSQEATADAGSPESPTQSQPQSTFGGMSWLRRDKGNDQNK